MTSGVEREAREGGLTAGRPGGALLLLGGTGQLGQALIRQLRAAGRSHAAPARDEVDLLESRRAVDWIERHAPAVVVYAAAYNDVARAELPGERREVFGLNRDTPTSLCAACRLAGGRFVFVSTDFVFDGESSRAYREDDTPRPIQIYGRSKLEGEHGVREADPRALIVRTSTLFGPGKRRRPNYVDSILAQARSREQIEVVGPPVACPTYTEDLAHALLRLIDGGAAGLFHVVNSGQCSRLDLAREAVRRAGLRTTVNEREATGDGPRRPAFSALDTAKYTAWAGQPLRSWQDALADHVRATSPGAW